MPTAGEASTTVAAAASVKDWLSQHNARHREAAAAQAAATAVSAAAPAASASGASAAAVGGGKRAAGGKRRLESLEAQLRENARHVESILAPPTELELEWVRSRTGPLCFHWHYVDGSTSARPKPASDKAARFDPRREPRVLGVSFYAPSAADERARTQLIQPSPRPPETSVANVSAVSALVSRGFAADERCTVHWSLADGKADEEEDAASAAGLRLVCALLLGQEGECVSLICANTKLVLRTLALVCERREERRAAAGAAGLHTAAAISMPPLPPPPPPPPPSGPSVWPALERWVDPVLMGWLLEPDECESGLLLPGLYASHLAVPASMGAGGDGGGSLGAAGAAGAAAAMPPPTRSHIAAAALGASATGELLDTVSELSATLELAVVLSSKLQRLMKDGEKASEKASEAADEALRVMLRRELRVAELLGTMELAGMPLETARLRQHTQAIGARLAKLHEHAQALLKAPINLSSAQQVSEALHVTLQLPKPSGGEAAARATHGSTSESHLKELVFGFPTYTLPGASHAGPTLSLTTPPLLE